MDRLGPVARLSEGFDSPRAAYYHYVFYDPLTSRSDLQNDH